MVTDRDENVLDYNNIELHLNGCALQENWKGAKGSTGKSFNFCDRQTKQWHQTWIDNSGWALYLDDGLEGNVMVLSGKHLGRKGEPIVHKISYTPEENGVVKQHWEVSNDNGDNWQDIFIGYYKKRNTQTSM